MKAYSVPSVLLMSVASQAWAQNPAPAGGPVALEEIIVTATRRAESIQNISSSVAAFTPETLARSGISNSIDLQLHTPNLIFSSNGSFGQPYIRGIGSDQITPGFDAPVATYVDGAYQARPTASVVDFFDVERVEVLKGPQGALYGRNATGGALNIITHKPTDDPGAQATAIYGNYDRIQIKGAVNLPVSDEVAFRVAGIYNKRDGYSRNLLDNSTIDDEDAYALRASLRVAPTDTFSVVLTGEYIDEDSTRNNAGKIVVSPTLPNPYLTHPVSADVVPLDPREVYYDFTPRILLEQHRLNLKINWDLGFAELQSITGWSRVENLGDFDLDGTAMAFAYDREDDYSRTYTQKIQLTSASDSAFQWIIGADYFNERATQNFDARLLSFLFPAGTPGIGPDSPVTGIVWDSALRADAWSIYADLKYDVTEQLRLIVSGRYNQDRKEADFSQTLIDPLGLLGVGGTIVIPAQPRLKNNRFTPRFGIEYRPGDDILIYATATNGFKSGGFNLLNIAEEFGPEKVWSYEAGIKADWLDRRLRTNFSGFYYDYTDLQVLRFSGLSNLVSNADARIYGLEANFVAAPVDNLTLDVGMAYLNARYRDYLTVNSNEVSPDNPTPPERNLRGNVMPRSPSYTLNAGAQYLVPLGNHGDLVFRGELRDVSEIYFDQFETPELIQKGYTLLNARVTYTSADGRWSAALWGRNLTNETYMHSMVRVDQFFGTLASFGAPRTYGLEVNFNYWP